MIDDISNDQYEKRTQEISSKVDTARIIHDQGVVNMRTKNIKNDGKEPAVLSQVTAIKKNTDTAIQRRKKLAEEQGFKPIKDVNELTGFWPKGADFEEFYQAAVGTRKHAESN